MEEKGQRVIISRKIGSMQATETCVQQAGRQVNPTKRAL